MIDFSTCFVELVIMSSRHCKLNKLNLSWSECKQLLVYHVSVFGVTCCTLSSSRKYIYSYWSIFAVWTDTVSRAWLGHNMKYIHNAIQTYNVTVALTTDRNVFYSVSKSFFTNSSGIEQTLSLPFNCFAHFSVWVYIVSC